MRAPGRTGQPRCTRVCRCGACSLSAGTGRASGLLARGLQLTCRHGACNFPAVPAGGVLVRPSVDMQAR
eukprot:13915250-Alexandrium_andersonii.AAC.1